MMTIDDKFRNEKLQYYIKRQVTKTSALSSGKINKNEYRTGEEILPSYQRRVIEQDMFTYSPFGKALEKQAKIIDCDGEKQIDTLKVLILMLNN